MLFKVISSAMLACVLSTSPGQAQSLANIGGPANFPPTGFSGQQFVDARGCLYLRAGFGATVNWVPRVDRARRPICGMAPSFGAAVAAAVEADMAPEPAAPAPRVAVVTPTAPVVVAPTVVVAAVPEVAPAPTPAPRRGSLLNLLFGTPNADRAAAPVVVSAPAPQVVVAPAQPAYLATAQGSDQIRCFTSAPRLERVLLRNGGTALVCTRGDGSLTGWRSPLFPPGAGVGAALSAQMLVGATVMGQATATATARVARAAVPKPPAGYKAAWTDDRLNPLRGVGTASGQAQQDQLWTRDIPAQLVAQQPQVAAAPAQTRTTVSSMSAPQAEGAAAYVQVGTFGQPANADGVKARLSALGLPVSTSKITRSGKVLQIVYAGPFGTRAEAQAALTAARNAGFGDAVLR